MKTTTKRFLSILLSVFMIFGTVALAIPAMVVTVAGYTTVNTLPVNGVEQSLPYSLTHNADNTIGGLAFHFDQKGHGDSYAKINADGTVTLSVGRGDMFWMPDVEIDAQSTIHVEVVMNSTPNAGNTIIGPAFDITTSTGVWQTASDNCTGGMLYGGKPGFGIGRYQFQYTNTNASLQDGSYWPERWQSYSSAISVFKAGQQINYDISKSGDNVTFTFTDAASDTVITSQTYDDSTRNTFKGAVGFLSCWEAGGKPNFTIKNYRVTNALVNGIRQNFDLVAYIQAQMVGHDVENLTHNTGYVYNGVKVHFDEKSHGLSYAKITENGSIALRMQRGDLLWFPNVTIDAQSVIHMDATHVSGNKSHTAAGLAYNIATSNGTWGGSSTDTMSVAQLRPVSNGQPRVTLGSTQFSSVNTSADYTGSYTTDSGTFEYYTSGSSHFGNEWQVGQRLITDASKTGDTVTVTFKDEEGTTIVSKSYDDSTRNTYTGAVGFLGAWCTDSSGDQGYGLFQLNALTVTNALVDGVRQDVDLVAMFRDYMTKDHYVLRTNLSLNGTIGLNIRVDANAYITGSEKLVVTDSASRVIVDQALSGLWSAANGFYVASLPVNAKEMTDVFTVCLKNGDDVIAGTTSNVSVKSYAQALAASDPAWADLMNAMLDYGAAAQELFGYNTSNLASDISGGITFDVAGLPDLTTDGDRSFLSAIAGTLTLESGTDLNLYFKPVDPGATLTATAEDQSHNAVALETETVDGYLKVSIKDLAAEELGDEFYITVTDGAKSVTLNYSALCWVKSAVGSASASDETKTLAKAVGVYASEAQKKNQ